MKGYLCWPQIILKRFITVGNLVLIPVKDTPLLFVAFEVCECVLMTSCWVPGVS